MRKVSLGLAILTTIVLVLVSQQTKAMPGGGGGGGGTPCVIGGASSLGTVAPGDDCAGAVSLGALDAPCNCDGGTITPTEVQGSTIGATAENPYSSMVGCQGTGSPDMASPAADVWYTVDITGNELNIDITSTMNDVNVGVWVDNGGGCGNLTALGCAVDNSGNLSANFQNVVAGQTVYIQISGGSDTDVGDFTLTMSNDVACDDCILDDDLTVTPPPINGTYQGGQTVTFCYELSS